MKIELSVQRPNPALPAWPPRQRMRITSTAESMRDDDFEEFDAFDISNVDLSPSPEPVRRAPPIAARPIQRTASLEFTTSDGRRVPRPGIDLAGQGGANARTLATSVSSAALPASSTCYSELVKLRDEMAERKQCLKSAIFDDGTLRRMSATLPSGIAQFVAIAGVGDEKYESFGREFLDICKRYASERPAAAKSTSGTFNLGDFAFAEQPGPSSRAGQKRRAADSVSPVKRTPNRTSAASTGSSASRNDASKRFRPRLSEGNLAALTSGTSAASGPVVEGRPRPLQRTVTSHMPIRFPSGSRPRHSDF